MRKNNAKMHLIEAFSSRAVIELGWNMIAADLRTNNRWFSRYTLECYIAMRKIAQNSVNHEVSMRQTNR